MDFSKDNIFNISESTNVTSENFQKSQSLGLLGYAFFVMLGIIILLVTAIMIIYKVLLKANYEMAQSSFELEERSIHIYALQHEQLVDQPAAAPDQPTIEEISFPHQNDEYSVFPTPLAKSSSYGYVPMSPPAASTLPPHYVNVSPKVESVTTTAGYGLGGEGSFSGYVPMSPRIETNTAIPRIMSCPLPPLPLECS